MHVTSTKHIAGRPKNKIKHNTRTKETQHTQSVCSYVSIMDMQNVGSLLFVIIKLNKRHLDGQIPKQTSFKFYLNLKPFVHIIILWFYL